MFSVCWKLHPKPQWKWWWGWWWLWLTIRMIGRHMSNQNNILADEENSLFSQSLFSLSTFDLFYLVRFVSKCVRKSGFVPLSFRISHSLPNYCSHFYHFGVLCFCALSMFIKEVKSFWCEQMWFSCAICHSILDVSH